MQNHDLLKEITRIVRDAIADGLIRTETLRRFKYQVRTLKGKDLEDYLQGLWDSFPPPNYVSHKTN